VRTHTQLKTNGEIEVHNTFTSLSPSQEENTQNPLTKLKNEPNNQILREKLHKKHYTHVDFQQQQHIQKINQTQHTHNHNEKNQQRSDKNNKKTPSDNKTTFYNQKRSKTLKKAIDR
jgi:hypothetical protein